MARRTHTYAIRLAVEGGGQVKADLVSVGQSGEQSLKRIEGAGAFGLDDAAGLGESIGVAVGAKYSSSFLGEENSGCPAVAPARPDASGAEHQRHFVLEANVHLAPFRR